MRPLSSRIVGEYGMPGLCIGDRASETDRERHRAACTAMSRFLAFVACEAMARDAVGIPWFADRATALAEAIALGMLRIDWGRP
jgi:hypothetical protein